MWQPSKWSVGPVWVAIFSPARASVGKGARTIFTSQNWSGEPLLTIFVRETALSSVNFCRTGHLEP